MNSIVTLKKEDGMNTKRNTRDAEREEDVALCSSREHFSVKENILESMIFMISYFLSRSVCVCVQILSLQVKRNRNDAIIDSK